MDSEREILARLESQYYTPHEFIHADECPMSDDFEGGDDVDPDCICEDLDRKERENMSYEKWKARIIG